MKIFSGNLNNGIQGQPLKKGWFIGYFMDNLPELKTDKFEVKWGIHKKGWKRDRIGTNQTAKTISILMQGKFKVTYPDENQEAMLEKMGDYIFHSPGVDHHSEALEDSVVLTIRWPSVQDDQVNKPV